MERAVDAAAGPDRRGVLKLGGAALLAPALAVAAPPVPAPVPGRGLHLVGGWLLTAADLDRLGLR